MTDVRLRLRGWTYSEPLSRGLVGERRMACCAVHLHSLGREHILGLKSFNYYPSPRPLTPQRGETCRSTLPIGTLAEGRHAHRLYNTRLDSCNYQEHAHARVCSALTYSFNQCPGVMPGFIGLWRKGPFSGLRLQGWNKPWAPLWTMD